ncbi:MAG: hypothetical protein GX376_00645, partial [Firmicutes bacterium]|nr:hypothetical protein [Bacillota bacterium]
LAGLEARILEPKPLSLLRVLDAGELDKRKKIRLYIMIEYKYITIIISSRGKILFIRVIPWEIGNLGYAKGADAEREILTECRSTLHYYLARGFGARPQQIVLYNEGGGDDHCLLKKLKTEFHLPVRQAAVNRNKLTWIPVIPVGKQYLFAACIGLGLRGVKGNSRY